MMLCLVRRGDVAIGLVSGGRQESRNESGCRRDGMITPDIHHSGVMQTDRVWRERTTAPHTAGSGRRGGGGRMMDAYTNKYYWTGG